MTEFVLDHSAVLTVLYGEEGFDAVVRELKGAAMSAVSYSRLLDEITERGDATAPATTFIRRIGITVAPFDRLQAAIAADIGSQPGAQELSFAECACLALAVRMNRDVLTSKPCMSVPVLPIQVKMVGHAG